MLADLTEVKSYLKCIATPEYQALAGEALAVMEDFMYTDHAMAVLSCVSGPDSADEAGVLSALNSLLYEHLSNILTMHHIELNETADLNICVDICRAILLMQSWMDKDRILSLCNAQEEATERFAALVEEVTGVTMTRLLDALESVDDTTLALLAREITDELPEDEEEGPMVPPGQIHKLRAYRDFILDNKLVAFRLLRLGYRIGYDLEVYLAKAAMTLDTMEGQQLVNEIMALALISSDGWSGPLNAWRDKTMHLNLELETRSKLDPLFIKSLGDFTRYYDNLPKVKP